MKRRGQSGINAAVLVAIIGAVIIIFVLFSSTEEREDFLNESGSRGPGKSSGRLNVTILLLEHPGTLVHLTKNEIEHELPSVNLYSMTESIILKKVESIYVKNSIFDKQEKDISFSVDNPQNLDNVLLSFNPIVYKGRLIITVNGNEIFNSQIRTKVIQPIEIPTEFLFQDNLIVFKVSGVGLQFWSSNEYNLEKIKITADRTDVTTQSSELVFMVDKEEEINLEKATLRYVPECTLGEVGKLDIFINTYHIYSSVPDCGVPYPLEFSYNYLTEGENRVLFRSQKGRYLIDRISVRTKLKETPSYIYMFDLTNDQYEDVLEGKFDVNLTLRFFDDFEEKAADIYVNTHKTSMPRTKAAVYSRKLNKPLDDGITVERGVNTLKIVPRTTLEIDDLEVALVEVED